jgi:hypothetical protein
MIRRLARRGGFKKKAVMLRTQGNNPAHLRELTSLTKNYNKKFGASATSLKINPPH